MKRVPSPRSKSTRKKPPLLGRAKVLLQELLNLVGVGFHLVGVEQEGRLGAGGQVLQDVWLPRGGRKRTVNTDAAAPTAGGRGKEAQGASPLHVHGGDVKLDPFQPQHHEEALREGTVADALAVAARLQHTTGLNSRASSLGLTLTLFHDGILSLSGKFASSAVTNGPWKRR